MSLLCRFHRKRTTLSDRSYLKTRPVGLQRLEDWHGHSPLVHLHPQVPVIEAGVIPNGFVIFCRGDKMMDTSVMRDTKSRLWQQKDGLKHLQDPRVAQPQSRLGCKEAQRKEHGFWRQTSRHKFQLQLYHLLAVTSGKFFPLKPQSYYL